MSRPPRPRRSRPEASLLALLCGLAVLVGCTPAPADTPATGGPTTSASTTSAPTTTAGGSASPAADVLRISIVMTGDQVQPNGEKIQARVGQQVQLDVVSDVADEIHAHTGGDGYELEVPADTPTTGTFTLTTPGSFEVESHERDKVVVILQAR